MKAIVQTRYGAPSLLDIKEIERPVPDDDSVLVRVRASSVNVVDWFGIEGPPYLFRAANLFRQPHDELAGSDFAGTVESAGRNVTRFHPGDDVFGATHGAYAEFVCVREDGAVALKPRGLSFEQAAAVPLAGLTALQAVRDKAGVKAGQRVLVNGGSGGVGTFVVQIAKAFGAEVTGVCSSRNMEMVRSIGADHVVDYTREDFTNLGRRYDVMIDVAGNRRWRECRRVLSDRAVYVMVGAPSGNRWVGPLTHIARQRIATFGASQKFIFFVARLNQTDLTQLAELLETGKVKPVIDRRYELRDLAVALDYFGTKHAHAKVVIDIS